MSVNLQVDSTTKTEWSTMTQGDLRISCQHILLKVFGQMKMVLLQAYCIVMIIMIQNFVPLSFQSYDGSNKNLDSIPEDIPTGSTEIKLDRNNIGETTDGSFGDSKFSQVLTVTLKSNVITSVSRRAFAGFSSLRVLILESNKLEELEILASDLPSIRELSLRSNSLKEMPQFTGIFNSLKLLDLRKTKYSISTHRLLKTLKILRGWI